MDELSQSFAEIGKVLRADYRNTYDHATRSIGSNLAKGKAREIAAGWRSADVDFIHLNKQNLEDGLDLLDAAALAGVPNLCTIHLTQCARYLGAVFGTLRDFISRRALRRYRGLLVTVLEERRRDLAHFMGDGTRIKVISNGVPLFDLSRHASARQQKRAELGVAEDSLLAIAVGRMVPQKRPLTFLELAESILREISHARFVWIGDGALETEWDQWVAAHDLQHVVRRLPWQKDVPPYLFAADVFVHTAEFEGLPLAILEAMSARLPCAITENLLRELPFLDSSNSVSIGANSASLKTLADPAELRSRGGAARQLVEQRFSFEKMAESYEALYLQTLADRV